MKCIETIFFQRVLLFSSFVLSTIIFLKNTWIAEDAYIVYRSIEQLFEGNGPVWNSHERVQVFTSALWYWLLCFTRVFFKDLYINTVVLSLVLWLGTVFNLFRVLKNNAVLLLAVLLLSSSSSFFDYTSSGLENVLAFFLISLYLYYYISCFRDNLEISCIRKNVIKALFVFGLIICTRHDLLLIILPSALYLFYYFYKIFSFKGWLIVSIFSLAPFTLWSIFSLIYYGFPFPNTAYAKLNTGVDKYALMIQSARYFCSSFKYDIITLVVIALSLLILFFSTSKLYLKFLGLGILLNLLYIIKVGADYMQGRFLSYAFLISAFLICHFILQFKGKLLLITSVVIVLSYAIFLSKSSPLISPLSYENRQIAWGISDERGYYFSATSLFQYLIADEGNTFPNHIFTKKGQSFNVSVDKVQVHSIIGMAGYALNNDRVIVDRCALSDPLLARLPSVGKWRIGHFYRKVPKGYLESIKFDQNVIKSPGVKKLYDQIKLITQSDDLFSIERIKAIINLNLSSRKFKYKRGKYVES